MFRLLSRLIGYWLVAVAVLTLVIDASKSVAEAKVTFTALRQSIEELSPGKMLAIETWFETKVGIGWIWSFLDTSVFLLPSWLFLGALGSLFLYMGRRKRHYGSSRGLDASYG